MWSGQRSDTHRSVRSERGFTVLGAIFGALTVMTATAVVISAVAINHQKKLNPNGFAMSITKATAVRDASDLPVITVSYRVNFQTAAAVKARVTPVHVRCYLKVSAGNFRGEDDIIQPQNVYEFGDNVVAPGERHRHLEGSTDVSCFLIASGATLSSDKTTVVVPKETATGTGGATSAGLNGKFGLVFTRSTGDETNCVVDGEREITVAALTATTIKVSLNETDTFDSELTPDLHFSGSLSLNPGVADYYGRMDGQFVSTANGIQVGGTMKTDRPDCVFSFQGSLH
jgi:hypothetical protein